MKVQVPASRVTPKDTGSFIGPFKAAECVTSPGVFDTKGEQNPPFVKQACTLVWSTPNPVFFWLNSWEVTFNDDGRVRVLGIEILSPAVKFLPEVGYNGDQSTAVEEKNVGRVRAVNKEDDDKTKDERKRIRIS